MTQSKRELLQKFLKGIETGSAMAAAVVDDDQYIQHNPHTAEGGPGVAELFARISKTNPKVKFIRVFEDGDFAFAHNEYDFADVKIAFELFRFENGRAVEHWDNLQPVAGPNASGRTMIDGETEITDLEKTESNRALVKEFAEQVLVGLDLERMPEFVSEDLVQHDPDGNDGLKALREQLLAQDGKRSPRRYNQVHRVLAEGNFVLCQCEGEKSGIHSGIYDLYRVQDGRIAEHWSTVETIPPRGEWKNDNGKF